jgi:hypothetical protein
VADEHERARVDSNLGLDTLRPHHDIPRILEARHPRRAGEFHARVGAGRDLHERHRLQVARIDSRLEIQAAEGVGQIRERLLLAGGGWLSAFELIRRQARNVLFVELSGDGSLRLALGTIPCAGDQGHGQQQADVCSCSTHLIFLPRANRPMP